MRVNRIFAVAVAAPLLIIGLAGCTTSAVKCVNDKCDVSVKTSGSKEVDVFGDEDLTVSDLRDDSVTVAYGGASQTIKEGESATLGPLTVQATDADKGAVKLVVTR